ncbi:hypothetical protein PR048_008040 [Dryococelus australis]|uniref:Uncharacterized protein n=1 Tax=Dryococelus australis TaxID=614101 RepID=A0ABQ9HWT1_9NEOP|nr:hypothetical protein PR048_008040 [Dryococelus australis]
MGPLLLACEWSECIQFPQAARRWLLAPAACTENVQQCSSAGLPCNTSPHDTDGMPYLPQASVRGFRDVGRNREWTICINGHVFIPTFTVSVRMRAHSAKRRLLAGLVERTAGGESAMTGAMVAERLACSPPAKAIQVKSPAGDGENRVNILLSFTIGLNLRRTSEPTVLKVVSLGDCATLSDRRRARRATSGAESDQWGKSVTASITAVKGATGRLDYYTGCVTSLITAELAFLGGATPRPRSGFQRNAACRCCVEAPEMSSTSYQYFLLIRRTCCRSPHAVGRIVTFRYLTWFRTIDSELQCHTVFPDFIIGFSGLPLTMVAILKMCSRQKKSLPRNSIPVAARRKDVGARDVFRENTLATSSVRHVAHMRNLRTWARLTCHPAAVISLLYLHKHSLLMSRSSNRGGAVAKYLAYHLGELGSIPGGVVPGFSCVAIVQDDAAGPRVFSGISRFPRLFIPALLHTPLTSPLSANSLHSLQRN